MHHPTSYSVKLHEIYCIPYQGTNSFNIMQSKGNNTCISDIIVRNVDVHLHSVSRYIKTIRFKEIYQLVLSYGSEWTELVDIKVVKGQ